MTTNTARKSNFQIQMFIQPVVPSESRRSTLYRFSYPAQAVPSFLILFSSVSEHGKDNLLSSDLLLVLGTHLRIFVLPVIFSFPLFLLYATRRLHPSFFSIPEKNAIVSPIVFVYFLFSKGEMQPKYYSFIFNFSYFWKANLSSSSWSFGTLRTSSDLPFFFFHSFLPSFFFRFFKTPKKKALSSSSGFSLLKEKHLTSSSNFVLSERWCYFVLHSISLRCLLNEREIIEVVIVSSIRQLELRRKLFESSYSTQRLLFRTRPFVLTYVPNC